jgi:hypothetical protein
MQYANEGILNNNLDYNSRQASLDWKNPGKSLQLGPSPRFSVQET